MSGIPNEYEAVVAQLHNTESCTVVVAAGISRASAATAVGADLSRILEEDDPAFWDTLTGWVLVDVPGGVLAIEHTGYGEPTPDALAAMSAGGAAALVRSNIDGDLRFGCARNGTVVFDDPEFPSISDYDRIPEELRGLYDLVYDDLAEESAQDPSPSGSSVWAVGLAMAAQFTGLGVTADDVTAAENSPQHPAPLMTYLGED